MTEPKTIRRAAFVLIGVLLALLGITATTWVGGKTRDLESRIENLEAMRHEWIQQAGDRLPVRGDGVPGNAWEDYQEALNRIRDLKRIKVPSRDEPIPSPPPDVLALVDGIRAGALRTSVRIQGPEDLEEAAAYTAPTNVALATQWCVRFELQEGRPLRAVDRILDAVWFGADLMRAGDYDATLRGHDILYRSLRCVADVLVADPTLTGKRMLPALERLHDSFPPFDGALIDLGIRKTEWVLNGDYSSRFRRLNPAEQWMSNQLRKPVYVADMADLLHDYKRQREIVDAPWPDVRRTWDATSMRASLSSRLGAGEFWNHYIVRQSHHRRLLTMLRLLLAACRESSVVYPDPFGDGSAPFGQRREPDSMTLWSVGPDGIDDGGQAPVGAMGFVFRVNGELSRDVTLVLPFHR